MNSSQDLAFVLGFSDQPALVQDLTPDTQALTWAVRNLTLGGETAVYDAVHFACERLSQQKDKGGQGRARMNNPYLRAFKSARAPHRL
jgi:hypothetical protein